jgi:segregation and condensation protein B
VIGRPILYKTTKEFLLRFGLKDVNELPSMEEFEKLVQESFQADLIPAEEESAATAVSEASASSDPVASDSETEVSVQNAETEPGDRGDARVVEMPVRTGTE